MRTAMVVRVCWGLFLLSFLSCSSKVLKNDKSDKITSNKEFDDLVKIKTIPIEKESIGELQNDAPIENNDKQELEAISIRKPKTKKSITGQSNNAVLKGKIKQKKKNRAGKNIKDKIKRNVKKDKVDKKMNEIKKESTDSVKSDQKVFSKDVLKSRRPKIDPFVVGEKVKLDLTYFNVSAGSLTLEVLPFQEVNGRQSYHFKIALKTSRLFNVVYTVDDWAETHVDYLTMTPSTMGIHIKESGQLKEVRAFFDWETSKGRFWETKITDKYGEEKKKKNWKLEPFAQNVISAIFYFRSFPLNLNDEIKFAVGDAGKNIVVDAKVIRKETIKTNIGKLKTVVLQPKFTISGVFKPVGDINFWFTDDARHHLVRIESKIKIGTIVGQVKSIK